VSGDRVHELVAFVHVADVQRTADFYAHLGFSEESRHVLPDGRLDWVFLSSDRARIMFARAGEPVDCHVQAVLFYLYAYDLDALRERLLGAGLEPGPIEDGTPGPKRELRLFDPDGYVLMIAEDHGEDTVGA
jgi:catechol 2,3-dioxygenase-like lactoylglutathione lyase family enzyme